MYMCRTDRRRYPSRSKQRNADADCSSAMAKQGIQNGEGAITEVRDVPQFKEGQFMLMADFEENEEYGEKARTDLRETNEIVQQSLQDIRTLLETEPNLYTPDEDEFLQKFLRPCKWYPKSAFELMKRFYRYRLNHPRYCDDLLPSTERKVLCSEILIPLPDRAPDGCRLFLINAGRKWTPKTISIDEIFRAIMLSMVAAMAEPKTQIAGVHVLLNMEGFTLTHATHITPTFAATMTEWVQRCLPCRLKGIHIINQPFIFNMVYALFKPFLLEKTRKRIHFHGTDRKSLTSHVGTKTLPVEMGGELVMPNVPIGEAIWEYFCWFEDDFIASNKFGYVKKVK